MKVQDRPYAGNWSEDFLNKYRTTRSWTPDAIVTFNGESTLPGCPTCKNRIDFSRFINSVNASGGIDGSNGCDISLKIPWAYGDSVYKDGKFILTTGVEVFVYYRGFFQVKELALKVDDVVLDNGEVLSAADAETRPYYPVFHGVIESIGVELSDGAYSVNIGTRNMLSFWDNQQINTQQGYFASDPTMSRGSMNMRGHVYTGMTPHQIIYDLFVDAGGSAEGTGFALRKTSNATASTSTGQQFYSLHLRYLQERFKNGMYGLRMFGASGRMYTALETQIVTNVHENAVSRKDKKKQDREHRSVIRQQKKPYAVLKSKGSTFSRLVKAGMIAYENDNATDGRVQRRIDSQLLAQLKEGDTVGLSVFSLKPFVDDIGQYAQVAFWESSLESKKAIANKVCETTGFEFYQDMDGDLVFKPPMYNMDTSKDRVYNIFREDIISISYSHAEPQCTYVSCKGVHFRNQIGAAPDGEWGVKGVYIDYSLVAKYGWRGHDFDSSYYNNPRQAYYAAAVELDKQNKATEGCDLTIPLRPEIKPGYPVWVEENDCFYYVETVNHSFSFGGSCTTSLTLTCQRKKFIPPGDRNVKYSDDPGRAVDLGRTFLAEKYLYRRYDRDEASINTQSTEENLTYQKITGFPNVVMAIDPDNLDPSMLMYDPNFQELGKEGTEARRRYLKMIVNESLRKGILSKNTEIPDSTMENGPWVLYRLNDQTKEMEYIPLGVDKSDQSYSATRSRSKEYTVRRKKRKPKDFNLGNYNIAGVNALDALTRKIRADGKKAEKKAGKAKTAARAANVQQQDPKSIQRQIESAVNSVDSEGGSQATIIDLLKAYQSSSGKGESTSPLQNLISALGDRKASFAPKAKGYFRYYSSSHPSPEHQGPDITEYNHDPDRDQPTLTINRNTPDTTASNMVESVENDLVRLDPRSKTVRGLMTRTMYSNRVEYVPTKDILALSFQVSNNYTVNQVEGPKFSLGTIWNQTGLPLGAEVWIRALTKLKNEIMKKLGTNKRKRNQYKISNLFGKKGIFQEVLDVERKIRIPSSPKNLLPSLWDSEEFVTTYTDIHTEITPDSTNTVESIFGGNAHKGKVATILAQSILYDLRVYAKQEYSTLYEEPFDAESNIEDIRTHNILLNRQFKKSLVEENEVKAQRFSIKFKEKKLDITPIFPISDDRGYEVFGAYQYGRGLKPTRGTLFDAMLKQDSGLILTPKQLNALIKKLDKAKNAADFREIKKQFYIEALRGMKPDEKERISVGVGLTGDVYTQDDKGNAIFDDNALANRLMTQKDEQVISNVPLQLAQIHPSEDGNEACECRILSTDAILLEGSMNLDNFVQIENPLLRGVRNLTESRSASWKEHQSALRGENIEVQQGGFATSSNNTFRSGSENRLIQAIENRGAEDTFSDVVGEASGVSQALANAEANLEGLSDQAKEIKARNKRE